MGKSKKSKRRLISVIFLRLFAVLLLGSCVALPIYGYINDAYPYIWVGAAIGGAIGLIFLCGGIWEKTYKVPMEPFQTYESKTCASGDFLVRNTNTEAHEQSVRETRSSGTKSLLFALLVVIVPVVVSLLVLFDLKF